MQADQPVSVHELVLFSGQLIGDSLEKAHPVAVQVPP